MQQGLGEVEKKRRPEHYVLTALTLSDLIFFGKFCHILPKFCKMLPTCCLNVAGISHSFSETVKIETRITEI